jgi:EF hand
MGRYLVGAVSALLLAMAGFFMWQAQADKTSLIPPPPTAAAPVPMGLADLAPPPQASERTREEKRFARFDKDKNGAVGRDEYLISRQKAFAKLDSNGDGRVSFDEYASKATAKFGAADRDRNGALNATEFAATRVVRKAKPKAKCAPSMQPPSQEDGEG